MNIEIARIIRSRRRTIALQICHDATLVVRAPFHVSERDIRRLVYDKRVWIDKKLTQQKRYTVPRKEFVDGEELLYLGAPYPLHIVEEPGVPLAFENAFFLSRAHHRKARDAFVRWYKERARAKIGERVKLYSAMAGLAYSKINITSAQCRWGSCSRGGTLNFSWRLIMAPLNVIDYVVAHEVAHLAIKNHSRQFWNRVAVLFPEHTRCGQWLKENGHLMVV
jgi:hypothetical protein